MFSRERKGGGVEETLERNSMNPPAQTTLTPAQLENWRKVLYGILGPYALILPANDIQQMRDRLQTRAVLANLKGK